MKTDDIQGLAELKTKLVALTTGIFAEEAARVFLVAARKLRDAAKREAPVSRWPVVSRIGGKTGRNARREQGALRKAIVAFQLRKNAAVWGGPAAMAQVNILKGRSTAPHGHLVEFGTKSRTAKNGRLMPFPAMGGRGYLFAREVQGAPANPFFRRAIESAGPAALDAAVLEVKRIIERAGVKA
jgi:HK97 gp10 family phage protein